MGVADERLLKTYLETKSLGATSKRLRLQKNYCGYRINKMRKAGVEVPRFSTCGPRKSMDVEGLKEIIRGLGHKNKNKTNKKNKKKEG